ncbi:hypothetical protein ABPG75_003481 [Micractinium tetrahymenae]
MPAAASGGATAHATAATPAASLDLRPLTGVRALASLAVLIYHTCCVWGLVVGGETRSALIRRHFLVGLPFVAGPLAVDVFVLLTGLLATWQLLPLLDRLSGHGGIQSSCPAHSPKVALPAAAGTAARGSSECLAEAEGPGPAPSCRRVVLAYWRGRARRILPAFAAINALIAALLPDAERPLPAAAAIGHAFNFDNCPSALWRNALFITNLDFTKACGADLWTLAVQVPFCPALRRPGSIQLPAALNQPPQAAKGGWVSGFRH